MKKYKLVIFDLDGTLADTSEGIKESHKFTNIVMGKEILDESVLDNIIGGPLSKTYQEKFGYSENDTRKAIRIYRKYYAEIGYKKSELYSGMIDCLSSLRESNYLLAVATLKAENLAKKLLKYLRSDYFFDLIYGMDNYDTRTKKDLIEMCMDKLQIDRENTILIGDSKYDAEGAEQAGIDFIGVTYGFGFRKYEECSEPHAVGMIDNCIQLQNCFLKIE